VDPISKKKFVKTVVRGLKKAAEGIQQDDSSSSTILDTPINGRGSFINNFRRGVKDLGNEYYAKEIYDKTKQLAQEVQTLPSMAQQGMEMDTENPMHHLQAYTGTTSNIFNTPMNQVHGAG
jgi:Sec-independent protein translocase protein TatA